LIIERAAALHAETLRHSDLYASHELAVPERLQEGVFEAKEDHVLNRSFAEVVVNAEDVIFVEPREQYPVEFVRGGEIMPERLLCNDTRAVGAIGTGELFDYGSK
jgi:hypothetical protein